MTQSQAGGTASPKLAGRFKVASGHSPNAIGRPMAVVSGGYLDASKILDCGQQERDGASPFGSRIDGAAVAVRQCASRADAELADVAEQLSKAEPCSANMADLHRELQVERSKREQVEEECRTQSEVFQGRLLIGEKQMDLLATKLKKAHDAFEEQFLEEASRRSSAEARAVCLEQRLMAAEESAGQTVVLTEQCEALRQELLEEKSRRLSSEVQGLPPDLEKLRNASLSAQSLASKEVIGQHAESLIQELERKLADVEFGEVSLARRQVDMEAFIAEQSEVHEGKHILNEERAAFECRLAAEVQKQEAAKEQLGILRQRLAGAERDAAAEIAAEASQATAAVKAATALATEARAEASEEQENSARLRGQLAAKNIVQQIAMQSESVLHDENEAWLQESLVSETMLRQQAEAQVCILQQQLCALQQALSSLVFVRTGTIGDEHNVQRLREQLYARDMQRQQMEARLNLLQQQLSAAERTAKEFMDVLDKVSDELSSEEIRREQVAEQALLLRRQVAVMRPQIRQVHEAATPQAWSPVAKSVQLVGSTAPANCGGMAGDVNGGVRGPSVERFVSFERSSLPAATRASSVERDGTVYLQVARVRTAAVPSAATGPLLPRFGSGSRETSPMPGVGQRVVAPREDAGAMATPGTPGGMTTPPFPLNPYNPRAAVRAPAVRAPATTASPPAPLASPLLTSAVTAHGRRSPPAPVGSPLVAASVPTPRPARAPRAGSCSPTTPGLPPGSLLPARGPRSRSPVATAAVVATPAVAPSPPTPMSVHSVSQVYRHVSAR